MQFNFGVERSVAGGIVLGASYAGSRGLHLIRIGYANLAPETSVNGMKVYQPALGRRNPQFASITQRITDAQSFYNALQLSAVKRFSHGVRAQASYTFSRSIDDASGINSQDFDNVVQYGLDWYDPTYDRGPSAFQARHNLTFNWSWEIPAGAAMTGIAAGLFKGWQVNNVTTIQSGQPFTVRVGFNRSGNLNTTSFSMNERPDLKPGYSGNPVLGGPDRYWDIGAFARQVQERQRNRDVGHADQRIAHDVGPQQGRIPGEAIAVRQQAARTALQPAEPAELCRAVWTDCVHQCCGRRGAELGTDHVDGHDVAADSDRGEVFVLIGRVAQPLTAARRR